MADQDDQPHNLKQLYARAEQKRDALESTTPISNPSYNNDALSAIRAAEETLFAISRLSLFSPNESLDDIATPDLPYLLPNSHLAELHLKTPTPSPQDRQVSLSRAREAYERFLGLLDSYDLLRGPHRSLYDRYTDDPASFSTLSGAGSDPARRRDAKIANFKAEKQLKEKLETLRRNPRYVDEDGSGGGNEELLRELYLAQLALAAHNSFQGLEGINRESEVLAQAASITPLMPQTGSVEEDARGRRREAAEGDENGLATRIEPRRLQSIINQGGPLLSKKGKPLQPFTLVGSRQDVAAQVFRPGHNLPTMSVDEYLEEERRRGGIIEGGGEASYQRPEPDEDNMEKADEETYKARAWDEFVEANPKGSGNTLNRG